MTRPTQAIIDCTALRHNLALVRATAPGRRVMAIIKANAYGHGLVRMARMLGSDRAGGVDAFGVACLEEADILRTASVQHPITLLEGVFAPEEYYDAARLGLTVVIHHAWQIEALEALTLATPVSVWLKIDTGMHRLGLSPQDVRPMWERLRTCRNVRLPIGLMTHFACADEHHTLATQHQIAAFQRTVTDLPGEWCLANSAAILQHPTSHGHWVRPGLMLYGVSPFAHTPGTALGLRPAMQFTSRIIAIRVVRAGEAVGYGSTWTSTTNTLVGTVAVGYADGYPRHAPSGTPVLVNGRPASLVGRVSMDMLCVDLKDHPNANIGDPVLLWGKELPVEVIAAAAGTIPYELLCRIAPRVAVTEQNEAQDCCAADDHTTE